MDWSKIVVVEDDGNTIGYEGNTFGLLIGQRGPQGNPGQDGQPGPQGETGETGAAGNGIASIAKTATAGLVDTYTITMTDGSTATFTVTNGSSGVWGGITGTLSDQTDLQTALGTKLSDAPSDGSEYVRKDGAWVVSSGGGGSATYTSVTYYVSPDGSDGNDGLTTSTPFATIQKAVNETPYIGDSKIYLMAGTGANTTLTGDVTVEHKRVMMITYGANNTYTLDGDLTVTEADVTDAFYTLIITGRFTITKSRYTSTSEVGITVGGAVRITNSTVSISYTLTTASTLKINDCTHAYIGEVAYTGTATAISCAGSLLSCVMITAASASTQYTTSGGGRVFVGAQA